MTGRGFGLCRHGRRGWLVNGIVGNTELVGVLELTTSVGNNDAKAITADIGCESVGRCPDEFPSVGRAAGQTRDG